jgi:hypothetical protein
MRRYEESEEDTYQSPVASELSPLDFNEQNSVN